MISEIIKTLQKEEYYKCGLNTEIAKGKNEYATSWKQFKNKIVRVWQSKGL